jgi:FAD/FMN-containing dehydrogenase
LGKNTGKGGLGIWTHNLNTIKVNMNYSSATYRGPVMKMGAGTQASAAYEAAHKLGDRVVGGSCATVGLAGGFTQGGGHSVLSSKYGLGADNVLEWEIVTANGTLRKASTTENADLYWALSGGAPAPSRS